MSKDPYGRSAKIYDLCIEPFLFTIRRKCLKMYPIHEGMQVLDVGCGTGSTLKLYQKAGCKVNGIDYSPAMVEVARKKLGDNAEILLGNASKTHYSDNCFDLVTGIFVLHDTPNQVRQAIVDEMVRVTKRNGRILLIDYHHGPAQFPKGWIFKIPMICAEILGGRDHFRNYRDFILRNGLQPFVSLQGLKVEQRKLAAGGNIALYLLRLDKT